MTGVIDLMPLLWFDTDTKGNLKAIGGSEVKLLELGDLEPGVSVFKNKSFPVSRANFRRAMESGPLTATYFVAERHIETFLRPVTNDSGEVLGVAGFSFDISARIHVENSLDTARLAAIRNARDLTTKVRSILRNIRQGVLTFGRDLKIDEEFSPAVAALYHADPATITGADVIDFCVRDGLVPDEIGLLKDTLRMTLGQNRRTWDIYRSHFPNQAELTLAGQQFLFKLDWVPMPDENDIIERCLVCVTDLSEEITFKNKIQTSIDDNNRLLTIAQQITSGNADMMQQFVAEALEQLPTFLALIDQGGDAMIPVVRELHTLKGAMRMFGFSNVALSLHEIEGALLGTAPDSRATVVARLGLVGAEMVAIKTTLDGLMARGASDRKTPYSSSLVRFVGDQVQGIKKTLEVAGGELVAIECRDSVVYWESRAFDRIAAIIMHGINNAIDHGYVLPAQSGHTAPRAELSINAKRSGEQVIITVADRGAGLALGRLKEIAEKRGLAAIFASDPTEVLFHDGTSTATSTTMTSGRGVGLSAVRQAAESLGGAAKISFPNDGGAVLTVSLPRSAALAAHGLGEPNP